MKTIDNKSSYQSNHSTWQRVVSLITLVTFFLQTSVSAYAVATNPFDELTVEQRAEKMLTDSSIPLRLSGSDIQGWLERNPLFERLSGQYAYEEPEYISGTSWGPQININSVETVLASYGQEISGGSNIKLVGTPFVQGRLVRAQIQELLGKHVINPSPTSDPEYGQMISLTQAGIYFFTNNPDIQYGDTISNSRIDTDVDMILPQPMLINSETVMVPIVYLKAKTIDDYRVEEHVVQMLGENVRFNKIQLTDVDLETGYNTFLEVSDLLLTNSTISSPGELGIVAGGSITLFDSQIEAVNDLIIRAQNIEVTTVVHRYDFGNKAGGHFGTTSALNSSEGSVIIHSYGDIVFRGGEINAGEDIKISADGSIYALTSDVLYTHEERGSGNNYYEMSAIDYLATKFTAGKSIELMANGQIFIDAAELHASEGHILLLAGLGITIRNQMTSSQTYEVGTFGDTDFQTSAYKTVAMRSILDAGKGITLHTLYGDISLTAVDISSTEGTVATATNGAVNMLITKETDHYTYNSITEGMFTTKTIDKGHDIETIVPNAIVGGFKVEALNGVYVEYEGDPTFDLDTQISELSKIESLSWMATIKDDYPDADWAGVEGKFETWNDETTSLSPAFAAILTIAIAIATSGAASGLAGELVSGAITQAGVSAGMVSLISQASLALANGVVNGDVSGAMDDFMSSDTLRNIAIAMVTAGAIASIDARFFKVPEAGATSIPSISQEGADLATTFANDAARNSLSLGDQAYQALWHATAQAGVAVVIEGGSSSDFEDMFIQSLAQNGINVIGKNLAQEIGEAYAPDANGIRDISNVTRYIAHAATGCLTGGLSADLGDGEVESGCLTGAGGAVLGEALADRYKENTDYENLSAEGEELEDWLQDKLGVDTTTDLTPAQLISLQNGSMTLEELMGLQRFANINNELASLKNNGVDIARMGAALGAFVSGGSAQDINIAADAGENAAENNAFFLLIPAAKLALAAYTLYEIYETATTVKGYVDVLTNDAADDEAKSEALNDLLTLVGIEALFSVIPGGKILQAAVDKARKSGVLSDELVNTLKYFKQKIENKLSGTNPTWTQKDLDTSGMENAADLDLEDLKAIDDEIAAVGKPEWLLRVQAGNQFNKDRVGVYEFDEVYIEKPDGSGYYRLDSYSPGSGEIVSRKNTQFSEIQEQSGVNYINEFTRKYPDGANIANVPSNVTNDLVGQKLTGDMILEIPVQNSPIPQTVLDAATNAGVIIRDIDGNIY